MRWGGVGEQISSENINHMHAERPEGGCKEATGSASVPAGGYLEIVRSPTVVLRRLLPPLLARGSALWPPKPSPTRLCKNPSTL